MIGELVSLDVDQYYQMDQAAQLTPTSNIGVENLQNSRTLSQTKVLFGVKRPQSSSGVLSIITPIKNLNPFQTRWTIKVRVTIKKEIHQYNKKTGNGRVFSFDIIDSEGTETRVLGFNNMVDAHYGNIDIGATYNISDGVVKSANKIYNKLNSGIEITLVPESIVTPYEDDPSIPKNHFSFMPINEILEQRNNSVIDFIGVVIYVEPSSTIRRRDGTEVIRHTIKLWDVSRTTIEAMIWGAPSDKEGVQLQQKYYLQETTILVIKSRCVCEYNGKMNENSYSVWHVNRTTEQELNTEEEEDIENNIDIGSVMEMQE
ncbi:replication protein A 70 kDa DNA-binding subunit A-like [Cryptomeria japonica]|uniref:replication protein A 70 kDa DNA-binding subunit A-like n=1 Tax=Cryptomeria japonica TaxID=3369 RepID=UPI0027DA7325|nr:replication protein A 70 kDa DNA-binding subunit A-like [Cryptomeria japonica]